MNKANETRVSVWQKFLCEMKPLAKKANEEKESWRHQAGCINDVV